MCQIIDRRISVGDRVSIRHQRRIKAFDFEEDIRLNLHFCQQVLQCSDVPGVDPSGNQVDLLARFVFSGKVADKIPHSDIIATHHASHKAWCMNRYKMDFTSGVFLLQQPFIKLDDNSIDIIADDLCRAGSNDWYYFYMRVTHQEHIDCCFYSTQCPEYSSILMER